MDIITLVVIVALLIIAIRFVGKILKAVLGTVLAVVIVIGGLWFFKPETLDKLFGEENVTKIEQWVGKKAKEVGDKTADFVEEKIDSVKSE